MRAVVDTNVVAYYLLGTQPFADEARPFWQALEDAMAPALWEAELANVLWMAIRSGVLTLEEGNQRLGLAARLGIRSIPNRKLWHGALTRAASSGVAAYDTLFVELAFREQVPLVTFDRKVLDVFSDIARRPGSLMATP
ncbi:MAG TPA: type II toxin-antitoxin system VapC family toxin [Thermoanaerobaculia bacterium]|nr:type II toxin-antitoxin system VapC family toxin [Thermoanaerobaculia bacterium]